MRKTKYFLLNPAVELLPLLVFSIVDIFTPYLQALIWGGIIYLTTLLFFGFFDRKRMGIYILQISGVSLLIYFLLFSLFLEFIDEKYSLLFLEIIAFICFTVFNFRKDSIKKHFLQKKKSKANVLIKLHELFFITKIFQYTINIHLIIVLIYFLFPVELHSHYSDQLIFTFLFLILLFIIIIYEYVRVFIIKNKLEHEKWLPVVNETGKVIGKVAQSVSIKSKNRYMHPVIRIALICNGTIYLTQRPSYYIQDPDKYDYPFEKYTHYQDKLDNVIHDEIYKKTGVRNLPVRYIFKYLFKNENTNRLIYLYTIPIRDEEIINKLKLKGGKMWNEKQIEENFDKEIFSECFKKEFEILKNTILMAEKIAGKQY